MKAAVVLPMEAGANASRAAELNELLEANVKYLNSLELWLVGPERLPNKIPTLTPAPSRMKLLATDRPHQPEAVLHLLQQVQQRSPADLLLFPGGGWGAELCTRLAFRLEGSAALDVKKLTIQSRKVNIQRPAYGNNLMAEIVLEQPPYCLSVARRSLPPAPWVNPNLRSLTIPPLEALPLDWVLESEYRPIPADGGLKDAEVVLAVGQGVGSRSNLARLKSVAEALGAEIGITRQVAMNGWGDLQRLIGISGHILAPRICLVAGASGAGGFRIGVQNSRFLVAINRDLRAPIFQIADVGIVGDLMPVLLELAKILKAVGEGHKES